MDLTINITIFKSELTKQTGTIIVHHRSVDGIIIVINICSVEQYDNEES